MKGLYAYVLVLMFLFGSSSSALGQVDLLDGLVACYPLDGDAFDISGNCLHGVVYGAQSCRNRDSISGYAMNFNGKSDYIEVPHSDLLNFNEDQDFSISLWVKLNGQEDLDTTDNDIISKWVTDDSSNQHLQNGYPYTLRVINKKNRRSSYFYWAQFGGYTPQCKSEVDPHSKQSINKDEFVHLCLNVKRNRFYFYINGILDKMEGSSIICDPSNNAPLRMGKRGGIAHENYFSGVLDDVVFWSRALSDDEIKKLSLTDFNIRNYVSEAYISSRKFLSDTLFFETDEWQLSVKQERVILDYLNYLDLGKKYILSIQGHTNNLCDENFCDELSLKRANIIRDYLFDLGYSCHRIISDGFGKRKQIASNSFPNSRKRNQRVEIYLYERKLNQRKE